MSQPDLLRRVIAQLDETGIEYMLTGSVVSRPHPPLPLSRITPSSPSP
jgi:hypothetical protein